MQGAVSVQALRCAEPPGLLQDRLALLTPLARLPASCHGSDRRHGSIPLHARVMAGGLPSPMDEGCAEEALTTDAFVPFLQQCYSAVRTAARADRTGL